MRLCLLLSLFFELGAGGLHLQQRCCSVRSATYLQWAVCRGLVRYDPGHLVELAQELQCFSGVLCRHAQVGVLN